MDINEILNGDDINEVVSLLKKKSVQVPNWDLLKKEYDTNFHPVNDRSVYRDRGSSIDDEVIRISYDLQRLAVSRTTELVFGIPVKRIYNATTEKQKEVQKYIESIFKRNHIDSVNLERGRMLFASCEVCTIWYGVIEQNTYYGFDSKVKLRCKNYSPMLGDKLYPLFDQYGDMIAMSVEYTRKVEDKNEYFFDCYTKDKHIFYSGSNGKYTRKEDETIAIGKIPAVYCWRPTPVWENTSGLIYEMEWTMSRSGNYLKKNSKPVFAVFTDAVENEEKEKSENEEDKAILKFDRGDSAQYITWNQAVENLRFYMTELRQSFFTSLQLPDWSFEAMKQTPMSAESRRQLFIDAQLKVKDEAGRLIEFLDREVSVLKSFLKLMLPPDYSPEIDSLLVENEITPFTINDDEQTIKNIMMANGGKPIMSQRESIEALGWSVDSSQTLKEIQEESALSSMNMVM